MRVLRQIEHSASLYATFTTRLSFQAIYFIQSYGSALSNTYANQKHPRCKKARPSRKHHLAYSCIRLKSVISGGGKGPSCFQTTLQDRLHSHTCIIHEHINYKLNFDEQQFYHN